MCPLYIYFCSGIIAIIIIIIIIISMEHSRIVQYVPLPIF